MLYYPSSTAKRVSSTLKTAVPRLLLAVERQYNRHTSFPRGRYACSRMISWGVRHLGFTAPLLRLESGIVFEYSPFCTFDTLVRDLLLTGSFEPSQTDLIRRLLAVGGVFIDVGAHIGYYSIIGATSVGPTGRLRVRADRSSIPAIV